VFFLTGVDQHGQKVQQSAEKQGIAPQEFVDGVTEKFVALWNKLNVRYDRWAATTDPLHKQCVQGILQRFWDDKGPDGASRWIYKKTQRGFYSVRQEQFLTDKERNEQGEFGPEWGQVEEREEENYYFRLTAHPSLPLDPKQWLLDFIDQRSKSGNPFVVPDFRVSELRNAVERLEGDLCISRPKSRLTWGIEFPFDANFVTFVWFDALVNYISFAGYEPNAESRNAPFASVWPAVHVIGKDILIPAHGVYWPIMLKALGFADEAMPTLLVHGWWNIAGAKMSKSLGNIVDPDVLAEKYGPEAVRYYLMSDIATGRDADFSEERLVQRFNTDLANSLGNLLNRTLSMFAKYRSGRVSAPSAATVVSLLGAAVIEAPAQYRSAMSEGRIDEGLEAGLRIAVRCNQLIDEKKPWALAKDPAKASDLDGLLYTLAESLRVIALLISPVLPVAAEGLFAQLNWTGPMTLAEAEWGKLPDGHQLGQPKPLFPRIEAPTAA
jgi:methionyl-tRNA synthetase